MVIENKNNIVYKNFKLKQKGKLRTPLSTLASNHPALPSAG